MAKHLTIERYLSQKLPDVAENEIFSNIGIKNSLSKVKSTQ